MKRYIKQLTKLAFKFNTIWVLILKYTEKTSTPLDSSADGTISALKNTAIGTAVDRNATFLNASYGSFYQALSQFTSVHCLVQTRMIAQEAALPTQVHYYNCTFFCIKAYLKSLNLFCSFTLSVKKRPTLPHCRTTCFSPLLNIAHFLRRTWTLMKLSLPPTVSAVPTIKMKSDF